MESTTALVLFGQELHWGDLAIVGLLVVLEGVLSIDNALVLGLLAKRLPKHQQPRALTYGLVGAFAFRIIAISTASFLLRWRIVKLIGGGYLVYIAIRHLFFESKEKHEGEVTVNAEGELVLVDAETHQPLTADDESIELDQRLPVRVSEEFRNAEPSRPLARFWPTVLVIELTDIAFAVDSILAAIALVGAPPPGHPADAPHPKLWVVIVGGLLGVVLMRFAAVIFIKMLDRFPRFETAAYLLVILIGAKLLADWGLNSPEHPHRVDFHDLGHPAFWIFWTLMALFFCVGFIPQRKSRQTSGASPPEQVAKL
jgi:YkoY family integral membrane protein